MRSNAADFHAQADDLFGRIATRYDLLCDLFTPGIHRFWKRGVAAFIAQGPWSCLLDAAAGISDVVLQVAHHQGLQRGQVVIASDIFAQMLAITRKRAYSLAASLDFRVLDAHSMPDIQI